MANRKYTYSFGPYQAPTSSAFGGALGASTSAPAPSAPAAPAAPSATSGIPDPYGLVPYATNQANTAYGSTIAQLVAGENQLANQYGLTATGRDSNGLISGFQVDPNVDVTNPFSRAALLNKSYHQQQHRTANGYAAAGQAYSGAVRSQGAANTSNYNQGVNDLLNSALSTLGGYNQQAAAAANTQQQQISDAMLQALQAALAQKG